MNARHSIIVELDRCLAGLADSTALLLPSSRWLVSRSIGLVCCEDHVVQDLEEVHDSPGDVIQTSAARTVNDAVYGVLRV